MQVSRKNLMLTEHTYISPVEYNNISLNKTHNSNRLLGYIRMRCIYWFTGILPCLSAIVHAALSAQYSPLLIHLALFKNPVKERRKFSNRESGSNVWARFLGMALQALEKITTLIVLRVSAIP